jgi:hypothetical protein
MTVDVPISQIIPIDITVPVKLTIPIKIKVAETALAQNITDLQAVLNDLFTSFSIPLVVTPGITPTP